MPPDRDAFRENACHETGTPIMTKQVFHSALLAAIFLLGLPLGGQAQTQQLRGIPDDPRSNLPSVKGMLQRQQDNQIGTFSTRQSIEQSERRQNVDRMNENNRNCTSPTGTGCTPPSK
jgi:hypothetical protein